MILRSSAHDEEVNSGGSCVFNDQGDGAVEVGEDPNRTISEQSERSSSAYTCMSRIAGKCPSSASVTSDKRTTVNDSISLEAMTIAPPLQVKTQPLMYAASAQTSSRYRDARTSHNQTKHPDRGRARVRSVSGSDSSRTRSDSRLEGRVHRHSATASHEGVTTTHHHPDRRCSFSFEDINGPNVGVMLPRDIVVSAAIATCLGRNDELSTTETAQRVPEDPAVVDSQIEYAEKSPGKISFHASEIFPADALKTTSISSIPAQNSSIRSPAADWRLPASKPPIANYLPSEILEHVYTYLKPTDFNAARHSCRSWFLKSLERHVLEIMLKRGGWYYGMRKELARFHDRAASAPMTVSDEWMMSKCIARECALGPDWKGNGLTGDYTTYYSPSQTSRATTSPIVQIAETNMSELDSSYGPPGGHKSGLVYTFSTCNKFLMVAHGCLVWIYELDRSHRVAADSSSWLPGSLRLTTSVVCPRPVVACSMDTSSDRYAIAVLMDSRMGIVCSLRSHFSDPDSCDGLFDRNVTSTYPERHVRQSCASPSQSRGIQRRDSELTNPNSGQDHSQQAGNEYDPSRAYEPLSDTPWQDMLLQSETAVSRAARCQTIQHHIRPMHIEPLPPTFYYNLCSSDDPPRSVAICPQRRCIAFGCGHGIELHWVDAPTGQDLNRYFPLVAASDHLYFLPPRPGVDHVKKLRLISSAGLSGEKIVVTEKTCPARLPHSEQEAQRDETEWSRHGDQGTSASGSLGGAGNWPGIGTRSGHEKRSPRDNSEHFRAVPLSDGYHILFTDPATGLLCLGSDSPVGEPTKLLRKVWFRGPGQFCSPTVYSAGADLGCGVRVVAGYDRGHGGHSIWLFSVPSDVFAESMDRQEIGKPSHTHYSDVSTQMNQEWRAWWDDGQDIGWHISSRGMERMVGGRRSQWPVQVRGQEIGRCNGLSELVVGSGFKLCIWGIGQDGIMKTWILRHRG